MGRARIFRLFSWRALLPSLSLSILATLWCRFELGSSLALLLCSTMLASLYVPALVSVESGRDAFTSVGATLGVALVWAIATTSMDVTFAEWLRCTIALGAFIVALCGFASLLRFLRLPWPLAAFVTTLLALLWLTWPVWLSHALTQALVDWLVPAHPLLAINGVVAQLGAWDRMPIAYRSLTVLNQDIPYHLPRSVFPAVLVHFAIGIPGLALSIRRAGRVVAAETTPATAPVLPPTDAP